MINALIATSFAVLPGNFIHLQAATPTLSTILEDLGTIFNKVFDWVPTVFTTILGNPLLFLMIAIGIPFIAIGVVKRLLRTR